MAIACERLPHIEKQGAAAGRRERNNLGTGCVCPASSYSVAELELEPPGAFSKRKTDQSGAKKHSRHLTAAESKLLTKNANREEGDVNEHLMPPEIIGLCRSAAWILELFSAI